MFPTSSTSSSILAEQLRVARMSYRANFGSLDGPTPPSPELSTIDARTSAQHRETLFCGAEQPFTTEIIDEPSQSAALLVMSLGLEYYSTPRPKQIARRTNGCGAQVHRSAVSEGRLWRAGALCVAATVVSLDAQYVPSELAARLSPPYQHACGCLDVYVGCAICGNPLGTRFMPCNAHMRPNFAGDYVFLGSAVSPQNPDSLSYTPYAVTRAPPPQDPAVSTNLTAPPRNFFRRAAHLSTDRPRVPRAPPPLPSPDIDGLSRSVDERVVAQAEAADSSYAREPGAALPRRLPRRPPPLPRSPSPPPPQALLDAAERSRILLELNARAARILAARADLDMDLDLDTVDEGDRPSVPRTPFTRQTLPPGATTRVLRVGRARRGGAGMDIHAAEQYFNEWGLAPWEA
ncbi:hypothetical protein B0H19DRAFT_1183389 [Mycena capillaripes]|nr:hypothetical protein B0H19DRAFT_1183389 [Mycena capillaripes]